MAYAEKRVSQAKGSKGRVSWRSRYKRPDGTWGSEPGFPTKRTAEAWGDEQEAAIAAGTWIDPELARKQFGTWAREWMRAKHPRSRTTDTRWRRLEEVIFPKWEHIPLQAITWFEVEAWANGLTIHATTVGHSITLMSQIMTGAVDAQHLKTNPLYGRRRTGTSLSANAKTTKAAEDSWARPEIVLQLARRLGPANGLHMLTIGFTGMNWGESCALTKANARRTRRQEHDGDWFECPVIRIDPDLGTLEEYEARDDDGKKLGTRLELAPPKNANRVRDIDLPPFLDELLAAHVATHRHEQVFCTPSGALWRRSNFGKVLRPAADGRKPRERRRGTAGMEGWEPIMHGLNPRALRHSHDTYQAQLDVASVLAHEQAGHKMPGIKGFYQHPTPAMRVKRLDGLQGLYERAMENLGWEAIWS